MNAIHQYIVEDLKRQAIRHAHFVSFAEKVIGVLLGEVLSSTAYEVLSVIIGGDDPLTVDQALLARSIYAGIITLYAPAMAWFLNRMAVTKQLSFFGLMLYSHGAVCPVLLAWGWKDWASQLDTWAGAELWDEIVVAAALTGVVVVAQALPCTKRFKTGVAAGGATDTLLARYAIFPSSFGLTLGYVWNVVATWFVGKLQAEEPSFHFKFIVQLAYTVIMCVAVTSITVGIAQGTSDEKRKEVEAHMEAQFGGDKHTTAMAALPDIQDWKGAERQTMSALLTSTLSFIYAWAMLDTLDDWNFGVMFKCASYSSCSYQSNFVYALAVSFAGLAIANILQVWKYFEKMGAGLSTCISLQINGLTLTVGWAWMNFYSTIMTDATKEAAPGLAVVMYVMSLIFIFLVHSFAQFVLKRTNAGIMTMIKTTTESLKASGEKETNA